MKRISIFALLLTLAIFAFPVLAGSSGAGGGATAITARTVFCPIANQSAAAGATTQLTRNNAVAWEADAGIAQGIHATFQIPADYTSGNPTIRVRWSHATAQDGSAENVVYQATYQVVAAGDTLGAGTANTAVTVAVPASEAADIVSSTTLGTITGAVAGKMVMLKVIRLAADVGDTWVSTTFFSTVEIEYTSSL